MKAIANGVGLVQIVEKGPQVLVDVYGAHRVALHPEVPQATTHVVPAEQFVCVARIKAVFLGGVVFFVFVG